MCDSRISVRFVSVVFCFFSPAYATATVYAIGMADKLKHQESEEEDEESVWIVPGRDDLPDHSYGLPSVSPWRAPEVLRQSREVGAFFPGHFTNRYIMMI